MKIIQIYFVDIIYFPIFSPHKHASAITGLRSYIIYRYDREAIEESILKSVITRGTDALEISRILNEHET